MTAAFLGADRHRLAGTVVLARAARGAVVAAMALVACATSAVAPGAASAAPAWPDHPLHLIVPFPPGGAADVIGRLLAQQLTDRLGQSVVVDNRPGAGTQIAAQAAARAKPDGYTLSLATTGQLAVNPALYKELAYDPVKSFTPVARVATTAYVISVNADSPIQTLQQLIAQARDKPGALAFSSCGTGTVCHLTGEMLKSLAGIDLLHVPFAGSAQAMNALLGDQVQVGADTVAIQAPFIRAGKLRGLVVTSTKRSDVIPNVPTAAEAGLPAFVPNSWFGIVVPAGTPPEIVQRLSHELGGIADDATVRQQLAQQGLEGVKDTPDQFAQQIAADIATWGKVVRTSNVKIE